MSDDLVQRVARLYADKWCVVDHQLARAVIAVCMEEAAKVCDACPDSHWGPTMAAAIRARIAAWPGTVTNYSWDASHGRLILPLPQEVSDE